MLSIATMLVPLLVFNPTRGSCSDVILNAKSNAVQIPRLKNIRFKGCKDGVKGINWWAGVLGCVLRMRMD